MLTRILSLFIFIISVSAHAICVDPTGSIEVEVSISEGMNQSTESAWHTFDGGSYIVVNTTEGDSNESVRFTGGNFKEDGAGNWDIKAEKDGASITIGYDHEGGYSSPSGDSRYFGGTYKSASGATYDLSSLVCPGEDIRMYANNSALRGRTSCYVEALGYLSFLAAGISGASKVHQVEEKYWLRSGDISSSKYSSETTEVYRFYNSMTDSWEIELLRPTCSPIAIRYL